jgi:hypothetical protein
MDEKSDEIIEQIEAQRNQLGANLNELETRVRRTTDWRVQFDNNPMMMLGAALGGGILLGAMVGGGKSLKSKRSTWSDSRYYGSSSSSPAAGTETGSGLMSSSSTPQRPTNTAVHQQKQQASQTVDMIKAALIGFATMKAKEFLGQALPGFQQHLEQTERQHGLHHSDSHSDGGQPNPTGSTTGPQSPGNWASQSNEGTRSSFGSNPSPSTSSANTPAGGDLSGLGPNSGSASRNLS